MKPASAEAPLHPLRRLPPLDQLIHLPALINTIDSAQADTLNLRRQQVHSLAFDKLAITNSNLATIVTKFPYHSPKDRHALLHAIVTSTPPPTLPGLDPDYAHQHLIDQHLLILYLLAFSILSNESGSPSSSAPDAHVSAKHPVFDQYCSATLLPNEYIHLARACVLLDLGRLPEFDQALKYARNVVDPVLVEYFVYALAADAGLMDPTNDAIVPYVSLVEHRNAFDAASVDTVNQARKALVNFHLRRELRADLVMSVCLTWSVHEAINETINDPKNNIVPLLSYISTHFSTSTDSETTDINHRLQDDDTQTHLALLRNHAHLLLPAAMGTRFRDDVVSWSLMHVLDPPTSALVHIPDLAFLLLANAIDYPRAVYLHYRIAQIRKHHGMGRNGPSDRDRAMRVQRDLLPRMQYTHMAELKLFMAQGVAGEWAWLRSEGMAHIIYTSGGGTVALGVSPARGGSGGKRAMPVAEWSKAETLPLEGGDEDTAKLLPIRSLSSGASTSTVELPEHMLFSGRSLDVDIIRDAPMVSPERPAKVRRVESGDDRVSHEEDRQSEPEGHDQEHGDDDVRNESYVDTMHEHVVELQTSQSPIRSPFALTSPGRVGYPSLASTPVRLAPATASLTPATSPPRYSTGRTSQVSTPASHTSSKLRNSVDPFSPNFALPRTPSTMRAVPQPSTTPPSVTQMSMLHVTPKRDGTPRTLAYMPLTPADAAMAIMSRRSRRSNPSTAAAMSTPLVVSSTVDKGEVAPPGSPQQTAASRASASVRPVTPFKSRLSNAKNTRVGVAPSETHAQMIDSPALSRETVILATMAEAQAHQEEITPSSLDIHSAVAVSSHETANVHDPEHSLPETPATAALQHEPATRDATPTIRVSALLPKFDYAQYHTAHHHESPTVAAQPLLAYGQQAVERAAALVASSRAAAAARTSSRPPSPNVGMPQTPAQAAVQPQATPSTLGSPLHVATPTVRPGRMVDLASKSDERDEEVEVEAAATLERARRLQDAGRTPAATARRKTPATSRTPYTTDAMPSRGRPATRAATAAAAAATTPASPRYDLRHKPTTPASPAPATRRQTVPGMVTRRRGSSVSSDMDATVLASPRKLRGGAVETSGTPKRGSTLTRTATTPSAAAAAAAATEVTPKPAARGAGTRAGLRSASTTAGDEAEESKTPTQRTAAAAGTARTRRGTLGNAPASGAPGVSTRRATASATIQASGQAQPQATAGASTRPKRAAAGKKK